MKKGTVMALVALLALAGVATAVATAKGGRGLPTRLTLHNVEPSIYEGAVISKRRACEKRRLVKVFHDENQNGLDPPDFFIGQDKTDKSGEYEVEGNQAPTGDRIIAQATRRKLHDGTVCKGKIVSRRALTG